MLRPLARWLDVTEPPPPYRETSLHADALRAAGAELVEVGRHDARHRRADAGARPGAAVGRGDRRDPPRGAGRAAARHDAGRARRRALPAARARPGTVGRVLIDDLRAAARDGVDRLHAAPVRARPRRRHARSGGVPRVPGAGLPLPRPLRPRPRAGRAEGRHARRHARRGARHLGDPRSGDRPARPLLRRLGHLGRRARGDARGAGQRRLHALRARRRPGRRRARPARRAGPVHRRLRRHRPGAGGRPGHRPRRREPVRGLDRHVLGRRLPGRRRRGGRAARPAVRAARRAGSPAGAGDAVQTRDGARVGVLADGAGLRPRRRRARSGSRSTGRPASASACAAA